MSSQIIKKAEGKPNPIFSLSNPKKKEAITGFILKHQLIPFLQALVLQGPAWKFGQHQVASVHKAPTYHQKYV
jgi:hypothetical protein